MNWVLAKPLTNLGEINRFEQKYNVTFPKSYVELVTQFNYGRPRPNVFDTTESSERVAKCLLSFDTVHKENIWDLYSVLKKQLPVNTIPFMIDQFGNFICFYFDLLEKEPCIVFWNIEQLKSEEVAENFDQFIQSFYEL